MQPVHHGCHPDGRIDAENLTLVLVAPVKNDGEIELVPFQGGEVAGRVVAGDRDFDRRMSNRKSRKRCRQHRLAIFLGNSDAHRPVERLAADRRGRLVEKIDDPAGIGHQLNALARQQHAAGTALKKAFADRRLEPFDLGADGRLRPPDTLGGRRKVRCLGDNKEGSEEVAFDRLLHRQS